jgi:BMFP domain-containing protein YqiC
MAIKKFKLDQFSTTALGVITANLEVLQHIRQKSRWFAQRFFRQMVLTRRTRFGVFVQMLYNTRAAAIMLIWALDWVF